MRDEALDYEFLRRIIEQWKTFAPLFLGDFYALTEYSLSGEQWIGWQFHRADLDEGMVQMFRRSLSPYESARFRLHGLESESVYAVSDIDGSRVENISGGDLMDSGLGIEIKDKPGAVVIIYKNK